MMRLTPGSKRALMEQTLKWNPPDKDHSKGFPKIVLINRSFINVARYHNIYRFGLSINHQGAASVHFEDHEGNKTRPTSMSCFRVHSLFQLLDPKFFSGESTNEAGIYFIRCLMENSDCKSIPGQISLDLSLGYSSNYSIQIDLLSRVWIRVVETKLLVDEFQTINNALPPHRFNKLAFQDVESVDEIKICFRQNTKELEVCCIGGPEFHEDIGRAEIDVNENVKFLELDCYLDGIQHMLPTMRKVFSVFPSLLDFRVSVHGDDDEYDGGVTIEEVVNDFKCLDELTALIEGSQITSTEVEIDRSLKLINGSTDELIARLKEEEVPVFNKARVKRNQEEHGRTGASFRFEETTGRVNTYFKTFVYRGSFDDSSDSDY